MNKDFHFIIIELRKFGCKSSGVIERGKCISFFNKFRPSRIAVNVVLLIRAKQWKFCDGQSG